MKYRISGLCLAILLAGSSLAQVQTFESEPDVVAAAQAYDRGDYATAFTEAKKYAEQGNANAQMILGKMYVQGKGVPIDDQQAMAWYRKAANQGNKLAQLDLGYMYAQGRGVPRDDQQAATWYRKSADQGNVAAQSMLGEMYSLGQGVPQDDQQAVAWCRKAAEQGDVFCQGFLGKTYLLGRGVPQDDQQAVAWFRKAADQGNATAQTNLGDMYQNGRGVPKDDQQAVALYRKAADQGDASAQVNLGILYTQGRGVPKDDQQAVAWYRKSAAQGNATAQTNLGDMYQNGRGVPKDDQQAVALYRKAADQGTAPAQTYLGIMYWKGRGVPKNEQQAYFWWLLASAKGEETAVNSRDAIEKELSPSQREAAQAAARDWQPSASIDPEPKPGSRPATISADATGSGFRVTRDVVVTNYHVIKDCSRVRVNGESAQVKGSDARRDLALLGTRAVDESVGLRAQRVTVGEPLSISGYPLRSLQLSGFNMANGILSSLSGVDGDTGLIQHTVPTQKGNSGGPVLDSAGNLTGVVVSTLDAVKALKQTGAIPQNVNFAINVNVLRSFLDAYSVDYKTVQSDKVLSGPAIAEKAKGFTVLVECWK